MMNIAVILSFFLTVSAGTCFAAAEPVDTIYKACKRGDCAAIKLFLEVNPELVNQRKIDLVGKTPLYYAVDNGKIKAVRVLLAHGADCQYPNSNGLTPWMPALKGDLFEIYLLLLKSVEMPKMDRDAMVALLMGLHPRMGSSCPVRYIGPDLMPTIYGYLKRVDVFSKKLEATALVGQHNEKKTLLQSIGGAVSNLMNKVGSKIFQW